jgi:HSP20 family protein
MPANPVTHYTDHITTPSRLPDVIDRIFRDSFVVPTQVDRLFDGSRRGPACNLLETDDTYVLQFMLPGALPEKFELKITAREVQLHGVIQLPDIYGAHYLWRGFEGGEFTESYTLPAEIDGDLAKAEFMHGILTVTVPKADSVKPKTVRVSIK